MAFGNEGPFGQRKFGRPNWQDAFDQKSLFEDQVRAPGIGRSRKSGSKPRPNLGGGPMGRPLSTKRNLKVPSRPRGDGGAFMDAFNNTSGIAKGLLQSILDQQGPAMFSGNLSDYLARAGDGSDLIASQLAALEEARARGQQQQQRGDKDIAAMYAALQNSLRGDQKATADRYSAANQQSIESSNAANAAIQQALQGAQSSQAETLANLGISDAGKQAAATQADYNTMNTATTAADADASRQALTAQGAAQGDMLNSYISAAGFRGNERRSDLQNELMQYLAGLASDEAQLRDSAKQQAQANARDQYSADMDAFYRQQDYLQGLDDRAYQRGMDRYELDMARQQAEAEAMPDLSVDNKGGIQNAMNYLSTVGFKDPRTTSRILQEIQEGIATTNGPADTRTPFQRAYEHIMNTYGPGPQRTAAINALSAFVGSSGLK